MSPKKIVAATILFAALALAGCGSAQVKDLPSAQQTAIAAVMATAAAAPVVDAELDSAYKTYGTLEARATADAAARAAATSAVVTVVVTATPAPATATVAAPAATATTAMLQTVSAHALAVLTPTATRTRAPMATATPTPLACGPVLTRDNGQFLDWLRVNPGPIKDVRVFHEGKARILTQHNAYAVFASGDQVKALIAAIRVGNPSGFEKAEDLIARIGQARVCGQTQPAVGIVRLKGSSRVLFLTGDDDHVEVFNVDLSASGMPPRTSGEVMTIEF